MSRRAAVRARATGLVAIALTALAVVCSAAPVSAHTDFESSDPVDGAVVTEPVEFVTISFTGEATPVGEEFVALNAAGELQQPSEIVTQDQRRFTVRFDPPLAGGTVGIRWNVQAADAHPIEGAFSFTVDAPMTVEETSAPTEPVDALVDVSPTDGSDATTNGRAASADDPVETAAPPTDAVASADSADEIAGDRTDVGATTTGAPAGSSVVAGSTGSASALDEFLSVDSSTPGETTATIGRVIGLIGVVVGLGMLAFAATTLRGRRDEVTLLLNAVRALGLVIALGAAIEYVGVTRMAGDVLGDGWSSEPGFATILRFVGGLTIALGIEAAFVGLQPRAATRSLSAMMLDGETRHRSVDASTVVRWKPDARSWPSAIGAVVVIGSFWFDGHTVSKGFRPLHAVVNSVHLVAGSVWVGGVVAIATVLWVRSRNGRALCVTEMIVRFSKIAAISLAGVVVAGGIMAFLVLDSFSELTGTEWGRILLLKTGSVGAAMLAGAYNHFRLLPTLEEDPESHDLHIELRSIVTAEAIVLLFVVAVTAWLVAAAS